MTILINTPNGNIGRALAEHLLDAGEQVVVISRDAAKAAPLAARGARVIEGSVDDPKVLARAFEGVDAAFWLTPPTYTPDFAAWATKVASEAAKAAEAAGTKRVVVLSSVGAHHTGNGPVSIVGEVETVFRAALPNVLALRPAYFMENFLRELDTIRAQGAFYGSTPAGRAMPMVATKDIAKVAAEELRATWTGHRYRGVHGPADVTMSQAAGFLTEALGCDVKYVEVPLSAAREGMASAGLPGFLVDLFAEMYDGLISGRMDPAEPRDASTTTPTRFSDFAREVLKPALG